jgi:hypothetical protein
LSVLYTVRCRFTDPAREDDWNRWYRGHLDVLLAVPGFLAAQRFHSDFTVDDRPYLAMYEVESPDVFRSDAYLSIWGFDEWRSLIDNWTRDISEPVGDAGFDFATPSGARLRAAFVSGANGAVTAALGSLPSRIGAALVTGLDRSCEGLVWEVLTSDEPPDGPPELRALKVAQAIYEPLTDWMTPASVQGAGLR